MDQIIYKNVDFLFTLDQVGIVRQIKELNENGVSLLGLLNMDVNNLNNLDLIKGKFNGIIKTYYKAQTLYKNEKVILKLFISNYDLMYDRIIKLYNGEEYCNISELMKLMTQDNRYVILSDLHNLMFRITNKAKVIDEMFTLLKAYEINGIEIRDEYPDYLKSAINEYTDLNNSMTRVYQEFNPVEHDKGNKIDKRLVH